MRELLDGAVLGRNRLIDIAVIYQVLVIFGRWPGERERVVPRPGRDYDGATAPDAAAPLAGELRLAALIDADHLAFNGRAAALAAKPRRKLAGVVFDSATPAPFTPLLANGIVISRTLSSRHSPTLRRAIALAEIDEAHAVPGTTLALMLPASRGLLPTVAAACVTDLPFLAPPDPISA